MPLQATSGAASYDGFGGGVAVVPTYIEDVFSTYLYTGTAVAQTITNNIDLSTKGGMVWTKNRNYGISHGIVDTARGVLNTLITNNTDASASYQTVTAFGTTGFSVGTSAIANGVGDSTMVSWTFRKQPKFFDVVTYTGNGAAARAISHNLGSTPGCMIVKRTDAAGDWRVYHRGCSTDNGLVLNDTAAQTTSAIYWFGNEVNVIPPTSTQFTVNAGFTNTNGGTYVAYLFAHDAGGFGLTGTDNVISCGSFTTVASEATINLGYEPQWVMVKSSSASGTNWQMYDTMRGFNGGNFTATTTAALNANSSSAESITGDAFPTATGFVFSGAASATYIYIAIRRGPMKVPTLGTSVFLPTNIAAGVSSITTGFPVDATLQNGLGGGPTYVFDRLRGSAPTSAPYLRTTTTGAESNISVGLGYASNTTIYNLNNWGGGIYYNLKRAPGFFDEVCDSGTGGTKTITHNLGVAPELWFRKRRDSATYGNWYTYTSALGNTKYLILETTAAQATATADVWNLTTPTATTLYVGGDLNLFGGGAGTYVNYLFATCAGVSKVGSYTGTATTKQIDCGFTGGARFVLIKRTDSTGDWYVWDSARGIVAGNDSYLLLNSTAAEVTSTDYIDTYSAGFEISSTAPAAINASGGTFLFLAVA